MFKLIVPGMKVKVFQGSNSGRKGRILFPAQIGKIGGIPEIGGELYHADWRRELPIVYDDNGEVAFVAKSDLVRL